MAVKAMNFKLDENRILDIKSVASVFNMTVTDVITEALSEYIQKMKQDPFYRLAVNVENASTEETEEILDEINSLTDDDLQISTVRKFGFEGDELCFAHDGKRGLANRCPRPDNSFFIHPYAG